jgi:hypothetical protein
MRDAGDCAFMIFIDSLRMRPALLCQIAQYPRKIELWEYVTVCHVSAIYPALHVGVKIKSACTLG